MSSKQSNQMKSFYRQRKKSSSSSASSSKKVQPASATLGSDITQPTTLPHSKDGGYDDKDEEVLRQFDMNMAYGPCLGMSRLDRWDRAARLHLNPPQEVRRLLVLDSTNARTHSLWDGRI